MPNKETAKIASARSSLSILLFTLGVIVFFFIVIGLWLRMAPRETGSIVTAGNQRFTVEVADTQSKREQGLGERNSMPVNHGMLFDFKQNGKWQMWMLNMRFSLDMAWLDENGNVVYVRENLTPDTFPKVFIPDTDAHYVLEVNAGSLQSAGVKRGDTVRL